MAAPVHALSAQLRLLRLREDAGGGGGCDFFQNNGCPLHDTPDYPTVCRGFPFTDGTGKHPCGACADICPEMPREAP
ncbi:MAG: hypothetical protein HUU15_13525 [Candidatus Brocadiae bacterium]|nr:hypothetical protein [Candidatus Brocadiia bacterium]